MTFWYNPPKNGSQFAELNCSDYSKTSAWFEFEEVKVTITDDAITFYGLCSRAGDIKQKGNDAFAIQNQLIAISVHRKDYTKRKQVDGTWKDVPVVVTKDESVVVKAVESLGLDPNKTYKGTVNLGISLNDERVLLEGIKANGQKVSKELFADTVQGIVYLEEREAVALKDASYSASSKGGNSSWGGSKGQTEVERLNERWEFTKKMLAPFSDDCNNLGDLSLAATFLNADDYKRLEIATKFLGYLMK
ncbi:hypothetical protein [Kamptonema sp. UHCC 0994]|uniref:hypothetical protein n=1 Tax=Kamptonema sp. UHCC 0994 TaxID=3031329 RepID=UPI0023B9B2E4|nr:hypothetical protein [Kamptonema sp. UHCC 0994]MDF0553400.1 hypothetical protein [Kamptonema sp. UHCC 0994]